MKKSWSDRITAVLSAAHIPAAVIAAILTIGKNDLIQIVHSNNLDALKELPGIAEKRAVIINAALKKALMNGRLSNKAEKREKAKGYSCRTFEPEELWREWLDRINELRVYRHKEDEDPVILPLLREKLKALTDEILDKRPSVRMHEGRIIRLNKSAISEVLGVDYESKKPTDRVFILNHSVQEMFNFDLHLFSNDEDDAQQKLDDLQQKLMNHIGWYGVVVLSKGPEVKELVYGGIGSSAGHQKAEKLMMADAKLMAAHSDFLWFGHTFAEFSATSDMTGAEFWKTRANLLRPWMKPFTLVDGYVLKVNDILVVKDVKKVYAILNARRFGVGKGRQFEDGETTEPVIAGDGAMIAIYTLAFQGQCSATFFKGFMFDGTSSIEELCLKHEISVEDFMNIEVEGIDGKMHRVGDYKVICGEGCWKGDKAFASYVEYLSWLERMAEKYPGVDQLYLLRQSEEIEDEDKIRRLTRSLIQQWMTMSPKEIRKITSKARKGLKKDKTLKGQISKLAGLWKSEEERTDCERLFEECPWLVMNPGIQEYLKESWERKQIEAASGKFRTEGQYPYIMQDPVALLEVWVLGKDANDPDLGILKNGEVSCADVPDGKELLCVRFPANFLTAMVKTNRSCVRAFGSMNGVMVISIHDLILIAQDGDVDGDEMCVIYDKLAIELTKRMNKEFNPPVILFEHGSKPERKVHETKEAFIKAAYSALWRAKRYDKVGIYANLASRCAYLAAVALKNGDAKKAQDYLVKMSAASTGAILAIDQVKGNKVDESLIVYLESIINSVKKDFRKIAEQMGVDKKSAFRMIHPYIQYFVSAAKRMPIGFDKVLPANPDNFLDEITKLILRDTGSWETNFGDGVWNAEAAKAALTNGMPAITVKYGRITKEMIDILGDNWFKFRAKSTEEREMDATRETLKKLKVGSELGLKEFLLLLWRNESSMAYSMEGRALWEKKEEYYGTCRSLLRMFLESGDWTNKYAKSYPVGYEFSMEERWAIMVNAIAKDALELDKGNDVDKRGSYAIFCLKLIANELRQNTKKNRVNMARFFGISVDMDDLKIDIDVDKAESEGEALFENAPEKDSEEPEYNDEYSNYIPEDISVDDLPEC